MGRRAGAAGAAAGLVLLVVWLVGPVLRVELDEAGTPPLPTFPDGVQVVDEGIGCGSGGCWRELTLSWPAHGRGGAAVRRDVGPRPAGPVRGEVDDEASGPTLRVDVGWHRPLGL